MMFKCINNLAPPYLCDKFKKRSDVHQRSTRKHNFLQIPLFKTTPGQRTFHYRGVLLWNNLDNDLKHELKITSFKDKLKSSVMLDIDYNT